MLLAGVKVLLCAVSMILTALFALSFSGLQVIQSDAGLSGAQATASVNGFELLSAGLMIAVGIAIDSSKYLFWSRAHHPGFIALSLGLVIFSWLASLAFFWPVMPYYISSKSECHRSIKPIKTVLLHCSKLSPIDNG